MALNVSGFKCFSCLLVAIVIFNLFLFVETKKNVLLIIVPNFRSFLIRNSVNIPYTPNLNLLSSSCLIFHNVYTQIPSSVPSRNSLFTSRRPDTLKSYDNAEFHTNGITTMPEYFEKNGYETLAFGNIFPKVLGNDDNLEVKPKPSLWSQIPFWPESAKYDNESSCLYVDKTFNIRLVSNLVCPVFPDLNNQRCLPDEETIWAAKNFIQSFANSSQNFFLSVGFFRPDVPFRFPLRFLKLNPLKHVNIPKLLVRPAEMPSVAWNPANKLKSFYDMQELNISYPYGILPVNDTKIVKQCYFASLTYVDDLIGQLLQELGRNKLFEKTVIAVVGDHGCALGERGLWGGHSCYDIATRVPLLIYAPKLTTKMRFRKMTHELVELVDIFPTLADLAELDPLPRCPSNSSHISLCTEGVSLFPLFDSFSTSATLKQKKFKEWKLAVFFQVPRPNEFPVREVCSDVPPSANITIMGYAIRTLRYKYIEWVKFIDMKPDWKQVVSKELYDYDIDPVESLNLATRKQFDRVMSRLRNLLLAGWEQCLPVIEEGDECTTVKLSTTEKSVAMIDIMTK